MNKGAGCEPTYCLRANPIERAFGDVYDKCMRNHTWKRLRDLRIDVERHLEANGPWRYQLSQVYYEPEITAAVERITTQDAVANHMALELVKLPEARRGFVLLPRRWVVERRQGID